MGQTGSALRGIPRFPVLIASPESKYRSVSRLNAASHSNREPSRVPCMSLVWRSRIPTARSLCHLTADQVIITVALMRNVFSNFGPIS